jgi:chaperonin cofactor prefoldin
MRRSTIAAILTLTALTIAGCKSQQQRQQEELASLQAKYNTMINVYASDCQGLGLDRNNAPRVAKCNAEEAQMKQVQAQIKALSEKIASQ